MPTFELRYTLRGIAFGAIHVNFLVSMEKGLKSNPSNESFASS